MHSPFDGLYWPMCECSFWSMAAVEARIPYKCHQWHKEWQHDQSPALLGSGQQPITLSISTKPHVLWQKKHSKCHAPDNYSLTHCMPQWRDKHQQFKPTCGWTELIICRACGVCCRRNVACPTAGRRELCADCAMPRLLVTFEVCLLVTGLTTETAM